MKNRLLIVAFLAGVIFPFLLGAFTRDWTESTPTDDTVANQIDDYNRYLRVDASDRLKEMIYGFTAGENTGYPGIKELIFKQQASAPGTTNADEITLYSIDDGSNCGLYAIQEDGYTKQILKKVGSDINFVIEAADIPADVLDSQHYAANSIDPEHLVDDFTFDTFPLSPSAAPDANYELANKKYVDDQVDTKNFGTQTIKDSGGSNTIAIDEVYKASDDGLLTWACERGGALWTLKFLYDAVDGTTALFEHRLYDVTDFGTQMTFPVKKDHYFSISGTNITLTYVLWTPYGSGTLAKQ